MEQEQRPWWYWPAAVGYVIGAMGFVHVVLAVMDTWLGIVLMFVLGVVGRGKTAGPLIGQRLGSDKARYVNPRAWVLALRRARQYVCCGREQQGCAVQALWGGEGAGAHSCTASAGGVCWFSTSPNAARSAWRIRSRRP